MEEVEALCDRIAVMANGKIMAVDTAEKLKEQTGKNTLEDAFIEIVEKGGTQK